MNDLLFDIKAAKMTSEIYRDKEVLAEKIYGYDGEIHAYENVMAMMTNNQKGIIMTPVQIEILLHCFYKNDPIAIKSPAINDALKWLEGHDLIVAEQEQEASPPTRYKTTQRGSAFVEMLCETPLPEQQWVDPRTKAMVTDDSNKGE